MQMLQQNMICLNFIDLLEVKFDSILKGTVPFKIGHCSLNTFLLIKQKQSFLSPFKHEVAQ